ncbi:hypothetical protein IA01_02835 [Flavobacterium psychrophilum]|uniref:HRDC domain-containing protein n=2 Tax=Flavobacterium psychrophilum TaxID=96345 RepID=A6GX44_FLAPJ|nr:HRDC domain-containing protein [Flavobacterium psychrophilum]AIG29469.1 hypothetical protein IA03_02815 [Flavobacterium psychrophilum]AIG31746.1 hypothetical protein IA01_02835 [Flavobacterium psychrophilum]AIG33900.1 hypothetical protein IA02_02220 [Flavobacterium psychrophilum]AIG36263.1 hypothetical protein IA04_02725 [Flavobacterium psychrophilum]AIG38529.1 hypothetical protein IA05_02815 [Flavobacterium psychrophilum]
MKIKVFHIRLSKEYSESDQEIINDFLKTVIVKKTTQKLISGQTNFWSILVLYDDNNNNNTKSSSGKISYEIDTELSEVERNTFETLKLWRKDKAEQLNVPSFMICHNTELITIAKEKPQKIDDLLKIKGFGEQKTVRFGDDIIALLNSIL